MHRRLLLAALSATALALTPSPSEAVNTVKLERIVLDEGNVIAFLEASSQYHVDAMHTLINERYREEYRAIRWETLESGMRDAPVARLEYRFVQHGVPGIRVYHAIGGSPLSTLAKSIFEGPTRPGTPDSPSMPDSPDANEKGPFRSNPLVDDVAVDLEDDRFFAGFDEVNVRARISSGEGSVLDGFVVEGRNRELDPEFKALRAIESDLKNGVVPRGGSVYGSISGTACSSCRYAMKRFADHYAVDVQLTQIFPSMPLAQQNELIASGSARLSGNRLVEATSGRPLLASDRLRGAREGQVRRAISPRAMGRSFKGMPWSQRSFRLKPILPRLSEGSTEGSPPRETAPPDYSAPGC